MNDPIYEWATDYFCSGCIVYSMIQHAPWSQWADDRDPSDYSPMQALVSMAEHFGLANKTRADRKAAGFPVRATRLTGTVFCSTCLNILHKAT